MKISARENGCIIHKYKYTNRFHSRAQLARKCVETKEIVYIRKEFTLRARGGRFSPLTWPAFHWLPLSCENALQVKPPIQRGSVVQKPINANPGLKANQSSYFS